MEHYSLKERLLITAAACMVVSVFSMAWGIPGEWLLGWPVWKLAALMIAMTAVLWAAVVCIAFVVVLIREAIRAAQELDEIEQQLYGREWRYVSRDVVCRSAETFGRGR